MARSPLFGRRIHIAGSIPNEAKYASAEEVGRARQLVESLVKELLRKGATFVIPVDAEKVRESDGLPICFDWLVWDTIEKNLANRPADAISSLVIAVKHHKNEEQIPEQYQSLWDKFRGSPLVQIESAAHWNMNSKRMEVQARCGDILIAIGGGEGVLFLANLYHDAGKPVVPLNFKLCSPNTGAQKIFDYAQTSNHARRLFQTEGGTPTHTWINRLDFPSRKEITERVLDIIDLLEDISPPKAFVVRLLNPAHPEYLDVQTFFDTVVQPIVEGKFGYKLTVIDGNQVYDYARIDEEIFAKLHRSSVVIADITGCRPNCYIELGYAFGRGLPTMLLAKDGTDHPFDIYSFFGHHWKTTGTVEERQREFSKHWEAIKNRPPLVPMEPLIP
ncbi:MULTISPECIES: hypothetical protein [Nitrosomonas]|uniref:ATP nucleosidase Cap17-like N-terminal domain-containing protein n=1 Tax=Nitrosomonas communis TaxID=44574 RepID=A0A0F7KGB5_9PROT|nr:MULTISPECIES: hypothetical protein [Nitrosomonas]AKH37829.1 hypothetical protein AAW31_08450 [Nitrosomonas communis]TYP92898.1 hypothetical protein BCL69_100599 [Nitrosomonas communis]UVS63179.1 hypothetical protein NX761_08875 [Nitrosomonas sp. PLL12]